MDPELTLQRILNIQFALRKFLTKEEYRTSKKSIPIGEISIEKEPRLHEVIKIVAEQIARDPNCILIDQYDLNERKKSWQALFEKELIKDENIIPLDTRSLPGHKILDHHMPHFCDVKDFNGRSLRSICSKEILERALLRNVSSHSTPYKSEIRKTLIISIGKTLGNVTKYRTITTKAIVQYFKAKRVFDPCIGWGGRLLGSISAGPDVYYVGCEPDHNTANGLNNILNDESIPINYRARALVIKKPIEDALFDIHKMEKFDLILTSPPYFNLEIYTSGDQSIDEYNSWDLWVEKWLKVVIYASLGFLRPDGVSAWSVKNFKSDKKYMLADVTKKIHKDAGWELIKTVKMTGSGRPGLNRIQDGKEQRKSEEETFCFRRIVP